MARGYHEDILNRSPTHLLADNEFCRNVLVNKLSATDDFARRPLVNRYASPYVPKVDAKDCVGCGCGGCGCGGCGCGCGGCGCGCGGCGGCDTDSGDDTVVTVVSEDEQIAWNFTSCFKVTTQLLMNFPPSFFSVELE